MQSDEIPATPETDTEGAVEALPGRDRPHRSPGRPCRLSPRFSEEELAAVRSAAASVGMTPHGFCADAAIAAARGAPMALGAAQDREALARLLRQLMAARTAVVRFGTNVNQAMAVLN